MLPLVASAAPIKAINITGNERVDVESVKSYITFKEGEEFDEAEMNQSVKALFATNLFSDIKIDFDGQAVNIKLTENPIISQVAFEGNKAIDDSKLAGEVSLKSRSIYTKAAVQNDVQRIVEIYRKSGKYNAKVEPKVILKDQNRLDLVFEINEGESTRIKKIDFVGNTAFSDSKLRGIVKSSEAAWYILLSDDDKYDEDRIEYDKELLRRFYTKEGYADFEVKSAVAELSPDYDGFVVTYSISEGDKYKFGKVNVETKLEDMKPEQLAAQKDDLIFTKEGKTYDETKLEKTVDKLTEKAGESGFAFVDIDPVLKRNKEDKTIDVTYTIKEGPKVYVDRININGNSRTLDKVIRREFRLSEGDPFNTSSLRRSKQRIENLGFFNKVDIDQKKGSADDKVDINVKVDEKSTGEFNVGAGYSTVDGVVGEVSLKERNFLGKGQNVGINLTGSTRRRQGQFSFTEPYFLDEPLSAGFDLYDLRTDQLTESSYRSHSTGVNLRAGYDISEHLRHDLNYKISQDEVSDVNATASRFIRDQTGKRLTSSVGQDFTYDTRDNVFDPAEGYILKLGQDIAGLGGDAKFIKNEIGAGYYLPLDDDKDWRLAFLGNAGNITGLGGKDVFITNRFFVGGKNLRGFDRSGIGPRDTKTGDALGGNNYYTGTAELGFPLGLPDELGVRGAIFSDVGSLWGVDETGSNILDDSAPRMSVGAGVGWASPFGPIRVDFSHPLAKNSLDKTQVFQLNFGTRF